MIRDEPGANSVESALATLQPIRDLAKNWDIDIAACLEEYLHDLIGDLTEEERRNLPDHAETLNFSFSQAALLVQHSSSVYSRKVEYLYKLVYKAHEELIQNSGNRNAANGTSKKSSVDAAIEEFNSFDPHVEFLLLDDVLPTDEGGKKINLQDDLESDDASKQDGSRGLSFTSMATATRLSLGMTGATNLERSTATAAAHSATQHVLRGSLNNGSLRLIDGRCDVGDDGILIMPGARNSFESNKSRRSSSAFLGLSPRGASNNDDFPMADNDDDDDNMMAGDHDDYDEHDNDGNGFAFADDGVAGGDTAAQEPLEKQAQSTVKMAAASSDLEKSAPDPWALLDPHSHSSSAAALKPLRIGTTCKLPPTVTELPSECVTGARTKRKHKAAAKNAKNLFEAKTTRPPSLFLVSETFKARLALQRKQRNKQEISSEDDDDDDDDSVVIPEIPLSGPMFGDEFLYIAKATARQKNARRRQEQKILKAQEATAPRNDDYNNDDDYGAFDYGGGDDDSGGGGDFGYDDDDDDNDGVGNNGMASVDDMFLNGADDDNENQDGISTEGKTFEDLCRAHIQAFAKGAEAYASETRLTKRVGDWHDKLLPILNEEENRPEFNIHEYTRRVISSIEKECNRLFKDPDLSIDENERSVDFGAVTQKCPHYEVCRLFLASLSLCNSGNVELESDGQNAKQTSLRMKLLSNVINCPMETYLAPSVLDQAE